MATATLAATLNTPISQLRPAQTERILVTEDDGADSLAYEFPAQIFPLSLRDSDSVRFSLLSLGRLPIGEPAIKSNSVPSNETITVPGS